MLKNYFKIALRNLLKHKGFAILNISGLAIGMTAGFLVLMYVGFELSYDKMHSKANSIYRVVANLKTPSETIRANKAAWAVAPNLEREFPEILKSTRVMNLNLVIVKEDKKIIEEDVIAVDSAFLDVFDFKLIQGDRTKLLNTPNSLVISDEIARKYFGNTNPVGKELELDGFDDPSLVTGVIEKIPENSHIQADILMSMVTFTAPPSNRDKQWSNYNPSSYILTADGTDVEILESKFPNFLEEKNGKKMRELQMFVTLFLEPFSEVYLKSDRGGDITGNINNVYIFSIIGIFILLIASINFINLSTARSVERAREVGIRKVIGAGKNQLAFQFIGESIIICLLSFLMALGLASLSLPYFNQLAGKTVSTGIFIDPINIGYLFIIALSIGIIAGIYPAIVLSSFKPVSVLKGSFSKGSKGILLRKSLVVVQFTISIALIIGTIVIYKQMHFMQNQDLGFNKAHTLIIPTETGSSQEALRHSIAQIAEVKGTSLTSSVPGSDNPAAYSEIENKNGDLQVANLDLYFVNEDFIDALGMQVIAGRGFSREFVSDSSQAMVVNEKTVALLGYTTPEEAIGARYEQWGSSGQIIGVVKDFNFRSLQQDITPLTMRLDPERTALITVKLQGENISKALSKIENVWKSMKPADPFEYYFLDELFNSQYEAEENFGNLFLSFALLAIFISCLGLLGLAAYSTIQRKKEIGIRKIIGASVGNIVNLLSKDFLKLVGVAFIVAAPIAWYAMQNWLDDFAYKIDVEWWMPALAGVSSIIIALVTVSFQAISAAIANPVKSLRTE
ncbi:ABC transporter permease [Hyunsoonleella pacifica]|uniref:ABC transporter permease n=1 Tax=Hyunsoonleella pacifica TaxID=1080224 RepID=A0A4Q9FKJ6_9FLAO|nr:ABC transporter permease [Hyunsoonleella pacifica]TBN14341.1 ABC transporter permease [Hyunsoonleella pacifica]GGD12929.1 ABC transporter permease [Hyunsoonleella pacifica]